ncbi:MAG TPA: hypothetical protein VIL74_03580 [Pyrinomonadaceae bacterium]|jgi:hypothetical protein
MNNLTQNLLDAKQAYLNQQQEQMLALYEKATRDERNAIIRHIDSFLFTCNQSEKAFWLNFRQKLERLNEKAVLFPLGSIYLTRGASEAMDESNQEPFEFLERHQKGDWGVVCKEDSKENEFSVKNGFRILSAYKTNNDAKLWIITEADRSSTTILLPCEY